MDATDGSPIITQKISPRAGQDPKFVTGSLLRHILVMTSAGAFGLMAIFLGDLANIFFLSLLGDDGIVAAVGYASSITMLTISIGIGLAIAATALVSPALGARRRVRARRFTVNAHVWTFVVATLLSVLIWFFCTDLLRLLGAEGHTLERASVYLSIIVPSMVPLSIGMTSAAILRSVGDARRAMHITLSGAAANVVLDPILIFGMGWGLEGAAIASVLARLVVVGVGLYGVINVHDLMGRLRFQTWLADGRALAAVALPAIGTNVATPAAQAYVTAAISAYGDSAVSGWAIIGRILPVAFGAIYALSGTVGPIIGQNYGARDFDRMRTALTLSLLVSVGFTAAAWLMLSLAAPTIVDGFNATQLAAELIYLFCYYLAPLFAFLGALFVSNAVFNTLGRPHFATALNWGRATVGTIPFVMLCSSFWGANGVLTGFMLGGIVFGLLSTLLCYRLINSLADAGALKPGLAHVTGAKVQQ